MLKKSEKLCFEKAFMNRMVICYFHKKFMNYGFDVKFFQYPRDNFLNHFNEDIRIQ